MPEKQDLPHHLRMAEPSAWFAKYLPLIPDNGSVLDVAAGGGRHVKLFAEAGLTVTAVDRNIDALEALSERHGAEIIQADLEDGSPWPLPGRMFDAVVVCNYLFRPLFDDIFRALKPDGVLLYETFALGNEVYSKPRNPDHLLKSGELLDRVDNRLQVVAYRHGIVAGGECPSVKQMICAVNNLHTSDRDDAEPAPLELP